MHPACLADVHVTCMQAQGHKYRSSRHRMLLQLLSILSAQEQDPSVRTWYVSVLATGPTVCHVRAMPLPLNTALESTSVPTPKPLRRALATSAGCAERSCQHLSLQVDSRCWPPIEGLLSLPGRYWEHGSRLAVRCCSLSCRAARAARIDKTVSERAVEVAAPLHPPFASRFWPLMTAL